MPHHNLSKRPSPGTVIKGVNLSKAVLGEAFQAACSGRCSLANLSRWDQASCAAVCLLGSIKMNGLQFFEFPAVKPVPAPVGTAYQDELPGDLVGLLFANPGSDCFALIDGARVRFASDLIDRCQAPFTPLFKAKAHERLGEAAPLLAAVDATGPLLRYLCSEGDGPWHGWNRCAVLFIHSGSCIENLARHLRRFTWVVDKDGRGLMFRFFDPRVLHDYLQVAEPAFANGLFGRAEQAAISALTYQLPNGEWCRVEPSPEPLEVRQSVDEPAVRRIAVWQAADRNLYALTEKGVLKGSIYSEEDQKRIARGVGESVYSNGFRSNYHIRYFIAWALVHGPALGPLNDRLERLITSQSHSPEDRFQKISLTIRETLGNPIGALYG